MQKGFIVCVDDHPAVVDALMIQLESAVGHICEIEIAESADEALEVIRDLEKRGEVIEVVIADEVMPGTQGSKLLEIIHKLNPNIMTILLTGQAGFDDVVYAVNHAGLNKCIKKPWDFEELKMAVLDLIEKARLNRRNERLSSDLIHEKNKAEAIVHSITDGILVIDGDDRISLVNEACVQILGRPEQELLGQRSLNVINSRELILLLIEASQRTGEVISDELLLPRAHDNGSDAHIIAIARTLRNKYGAPMGVVTILRDITKEKEISRMKINFLSTVSHELRTPLTSILSTFELLLQGSLGDLTEEQQEFISISQQQGEFLAELIENLIDLTNLESNQMDLSMQSVDIASVASDAMEAVREAIETKDLEFIVDIQPDLPAITADTQKINRLLKNLLINAVKFTEQGHIQLHIQCVTDAIEIRVIDTGIGIASEHFEKIFEKFFQVDNSSTREFGGSGLGLAICRAIVQAHQGRIWVTSTPQEGSTFYVTLPLKMDTNRPPRSPKKKSFFGFVLGDEET